MNAMVDVILPDAPGEDEPVNIEAVLESLQPGDNKKKPMMFRKHHAGIEAALARGVTHSDIRAALKRGGLSLSAATFRKMLDAERQLRNKDAVGSDDQKGGVE